MSDSARDKLCLLSLLGKMVLFLLLSMFFILMNCIVLYNSSFTHFYKVAKSSTAIANLESFTCVRATACFFILLQLIKTMSFLESLTL